MAYVTAEARRELADAVADVADELGRAVGLLGAAYEALDEASGDRLEAELFKPLQGAYGSAKRLHAGFCSRHGLEARAFGAGSEDGGRLGARDLIDRAVAMTERADATLAGLADSAVAIDVGDAELRTGLAALRSSLGGLRGRARELERRLGR